MGHRQSCADFARSDTVNDRLFVSTPVRGD